MNKFKTLIPVLLLFVFMSCKEKGEAPPVSPAVQARCDSISREINRLSKNLNDTLKSGALQFLMKHVPYRTHQQNPNLTVYSDTIRKYASEPKLQEEKLREAASLYSHQNRGKTVNDAFHLTGKQLVEHVSVVTDFHRLTSWSGEIPPDIFREYLLPYNIYSDQDEQWMQYYRERFFQEHDSAFLDMPLEEAFKIVHEWVYKKTKKFRVRWGSQGLYLPDLNPVTYGFLRVGSCDDIGNLSLIVMRSLGIPTAIDIAPVYLNHSNGHSWNTLVFSDNQSVPYIGNSLNPAKYKNARQKIAKVYRQSFSAQRKQQKYLAKEPKTGSSIPELFFSRDVTDQYTETSDLVIPLEKKLLKNNKIAWLTVFTREGWKPVGWSESGKNTVTFNKVGRGGVYNIVNSKGKNITKKNAPFLLKPDGEVLYFVPDTSCGRSINLIRKFPPNKNRTKWLESMVGGRFEGANISDFSDRKILAKIVDTPSEHFNTLRINNSVPYRYVRYISPPNSRGYVAEIRFLGSDSLQSSLKGNIIGFNVWKKHRAFDADPLTYVNIWKRNYWVGVGMEFEKPRIITKIKYMPRNDMNAIQPGDEYELLYWNGGWKSLGRKIADSTTLQYDNVPYNALSWLKNHSSGREERIFTYENGKQVWW